MQLANDTGGRYCLLADPGPMTARLVRGCIALTFTACVMYSLLHAATPALLYADTVKA